MGERTVYCASFAPTAVLYCTVVPNWGGEVSLRCRERTSSPGRQSVPLASHPAYSPVFWLFDEWLAKDIPIR